METFSVLLYALVFPLLFFEHMFSVRCFIGTRPLWYRGRNQAKYQLTVYVSAVISVAALWYSFTATTALLCGVVQVAFSKATFNYFYKRSLSRTAQSLYNVMAADETYFGKSKKEVQAEAIRFAAESIRRSVKGDY